MTEAAASAPSKTPAPPEILALVERFHLHRESYQSPSYNETQLRREFVDPFFKALGWDVDNLRGHAEAYKEVIHEDAIRVGGSTKAPDYCFRVGPTRKFFVETKKPAIDLKQNPEPAYQLRRYAWSAKLPLSILTDFEELAVYNCRARPGKNDKASAERTLYLRYDEYADRWNEIASIFSRDAVYRGSFDKYAETKKKRGTAEVDEAFLKEIESWREKLARNLALRNPDLSQRDLNYAVQKTIDRIIFLRICEDRGIESKRLQGLVNGPNIYPRLCEVFREADVRYNSGLFHFQQEKGRPDEPDQWTLDLTIDDKLLGEIIGHLYYPDCPYEFSVLPADILGQVYEQFLGKVIRLTKGHRAVVEDKPEVKKAGGVYYTPTYVVDYIVANTVGKLLEGKTPQEIGGLTANWRPSKTKRPLTILDPACGSGSFLIGAYQYLLDWHRDWYTNHDPEKHLRRKAPPIYEAPRDNLAPREHTGGRPPETTDAPDYRLTTAERKRILLSHIYGVDVDPQAVEVTKLSLLLKVLEGENRETLQRQLFARERALPDLGHNIKCGNSLIGPDFYAARRPASARSRASRTPDGRQQSLFDEEELLRINAFDWHREFPAILQSGGFDAVIGNPPYVRMEMFKDIKDYLRQRYACHAERTDLYVYFIEKEHDLLREGGRFGMIVSNKFIRAKYGQPVRKRLADVATIERIVDLAGLPVFRGATVRTVVLISRQGRKEHPRPVLYSPPPPKDDLVRADGGTDTLAEIADPLAYEVPATELKEIGWRLIRKEHSALLDKLREKSIALCDFIGTNVLFGLKTGLNDALIVGRTERDELVQADSDSAILLKPILFGRDVRRYQVRDAGRFVIYCHPDRKIRDFPAVRNHLQRHRDSLLRRAGKQEWFELQQPAVALLPYLERAKIVYPIIAPECRFSLDHDGFFVNDKMFVIPTDNVALLALLNSRLANFYFSVTCAALEGVGDAYLEFRAQYVDPFPVTGLLQDQAKAESLAHSGNLMLSLHRQLQQAKTGHQQTALKRQIEATDRALDQLVYNLYGLTDEEIRIVEEATRQ